MAGTTRDKFFDAINESYDALFAAIEATEARGHALSKAVIDEAKTGEMEIVALARQWVDAPANVFDNLQAMLDAQARAQRRVLELASDALSGAGEYGSDIQDALRRAIKANAKAGEATVEVARKAYTRVRGGEGIESDGRRKPTATRVPIAEGTSTNSGGTADS